MTTLAKGVRWERDSRRTARPDGQGTARGGSAHASSADSPDDRSNRPIAAFGDPSRNTGDKEGDTDFPAPPLRLDTRPIPTRLPMGLSEDELARGYGMHRVELVALAFFAAVGIAAGLGVPPPWGLL